jgi:nucleoid DNA-binding protein
MILKDTIISEGRLNLNGVGTFKVNERKARKGINPKTREEIKIPASKTVGFKPTTVLKEEL